MLPPASQSQSVYDSLSSCPFSGTPCRGEPGGGKRIEMALREPSAVLIALHDARRAAATPQPATRNRDVLAAQRRERARVRSERRQPFRADTPAGHGDGRWLRDW